MISRPKNNWEKIKTGIVAGTALFGVGISEVSKVNAQATIEQEQTVIDPDFKPRMSDLNILLDPSDPVSLEKNKQFIRDLIIFAEENLQGIGNDMDYSIHAPDENLDIHWSALTKMVQIDKMIVLDDGSVMQYTLTYTRDAIPELRTAALEIKKILSQNEQNKIEMEKGFPLALMIIFNIQTGKPELLLLAKENNRDVLNFLGFSESDLLKIHVPSLSDLNKTEELRNPFPSSDRDNNGEMYNIDPASETGKKMIQIFRGSIFYLLPKS
jgi:hypothetical protein